MIAAALVGLLAGRALAVPIGNIHFQKSDDVQQVVYKGREAPAEYKRASVFLRLGNGNVCTGVLLKANVVLTAAHCLINEDKTEKLPELVSFFDESGKAREGGVKAKAAFVHALFEYRAKQADLAVVLLDGDAPEGHLTAEINRKRTGMAQSVDVTGAGRDENQVNGTLKTAPMSPLMGPNGLVGDGALCHGDSGGPGFLPGAETLTVMSVNSTGHDVDNVGTCAGGGINGVTLTADYASWIDNAVSNVDLLDPGQIVHRL